MKITEYYLSHSKSADGNYTIKTEAVFGIPILWRWFGAKKVEKIYHGNGTVWHDMDGFRCCSSSQCSWLFDILADIKYKELKGG